MSDLSAAVLRRVNPVLEREVQERMRSKRAPILLFLFVGLLGAMAYLVYAVTVATHQGRTDPTELASLGKSMFEWVLMLMLLLVVLSVPGLASGAISGERERQTLLPMQVTLLRPRRIVLGKVMASCAYLTFLLVAAAPLLTMSYVIGGVSVSQIAAGLFSVIFVGFVLSSISVMCSTITKRQTSSTVLSLFLVLVLLFGVPIAYGLTSAFTPRNQPAPSVLLAPNPYTFVAASAGGNATRTRFGGTAGGPLSSVREGIIELNEVNERGFEAGGPGMFVDDGDRGTATGFVIASILVQGAIALLAILLASRRLRTPAATER